MIKLFLIAAVAVAATYAAPQVVSTTVAPVTATNDYYRQYNPYYTNTYEPYSRFNSFDPYRTNYFGNDYYNRNTYKNDPYFGNNYNNRQWNDGFYRQNYFGNDYYNRQLYDGYYRKNYLGTNYVNKNIYRNDPLYHKNVYNSEYNKNYVAGPEGGAKILRFENNANPDGTYVYGYETENGISAEQQGSPVIGADNEPGNGATGSFSYTSPEGIHFRTTYVADENGYRAQQSDGSRGDLPVPYSVKASTVAPVLQQK